MHIRRLLLGTIVISIGLVLAALPIGVVDASLAPSVQLQGGAFPTPTPGPDGQIIYIVQEGDDFWTIAAVAGMSVEELFALNGIQPGDYAIPGMELLLGFAGPAQGTPAPISQPTETPEEPTPTPQFSTGQICVLLYIDENGDAHLAEGEVPLADGQVSIVNAAGALAGEITTESIVTEDGPQSQCVEDLEADDYNVSAAVPEGYNPTTAMNVPLRIEPGDIKFVQFGAQPSAALSQSNRSERSDRSLWFGVFGVLMLMAAAGLGVYAYRYSRKTPRSLR